ncbi:MAG: hypothetical protein A3G75_10635 [Verrucomicrobia bacterium RIFCSPLOWO2_12_FULL_64_8]|nr:MAG: hypothetical protein A3G75_10635 [Verrucomicrobia bacterium RIFCSPLOWO2_12_FULL_64_8]
MTNKVLILRSEAGARRLLALTLADAGYDIRPYGVPAEALQCAQQELFDLVVVDQVLAEATGLDWIDELRKVQPTVPVLLVAEKLDLAAVIKGIRLGVVDVLNQPDDAAAILRRADTLLRPETVAADAGGSDDDRLSVALQAVLAQPERQSDTALLEKEREALAADWAAIHEEQIRLRKERHRLRNEAMIHEGEKLRLEKAKAEADADVERSRAEAERLETEREQMVADAEFLREQENNLRVYEQRLRELLAASEAERVSRQAATPERPNGEPGSGIQSAWDKVNRAMDMLEAERRSFNDQKITLRETEKRLQEWEARLKEREAQLNAREQQADTQAAKAAAKRAPLGMAKAIFTGTRK